MNANTKLTKYAGGMRLTVALRESEYGTPRPSVQLDAPRGTPYRLVSALLHQLAAALEMASDSESWVVQIESLYEGGRVYLELAKGDAAEAARGMKVIQKVANAAQ